MNIKLKTFIKRYFSDIYLYDYKKRMSKKLAKNKMLRQVPESEYPERLSEIFYKKLGYELDLKNPKNWNEKLQWLKLYDSTQEKTDLTDKYKAKQLVGDKIGAEYVIPALSGKYKSFDEIDFKSLPDKFVLKTNHGSGTNFIVKNKKRFLRTGEYKIAKTYFDTWMQLDYGFDDGFELHYSKIDPCIFVEEYIETFEGPVKEYSFLCFHGEPKYCILKTYGDCISSYNRNVYDMDWKFYPDYIFGKPPVAVEPKPEKYDEMIQLAQKLSKGFTFVRVDFDCVENNIYFGELTFTSGSGFTKITPESFNSELGSYIKLPL